MACKILYNVSDSQKANDYAVEALKQLLTISSAILAFTITFINHILGSSCSSANYSFLVPIGWLFLLVSIWCAWVAIADSARRLGTGKVRGYAFKKGRPRILAKTAQWCFLLGLSLIGAYAILNLILD